MLVPNKKLEQLLKRISKNDKDSLSQLYNLTNKDVYAFSLSILKNTYEAEDVLQEIYIKIYENAHLYQSNGKPLAWILTITKNLSLMKLRKTKHHIDIHELEEVIASDKEENVDNKLFIETIFKYITDEERNILILHSVSGYKHREISSMLELPLSTVLSKYNRAIKKIKQRMGE